MGISDVRPVGHMEAPTFGKRAALTRTETYGEHRRCAGGCGAILSRYNPGTECDACKRREKRGIAALESLAAKKRELEDRHGRSEPVEILDIAAELAA